MIEHLKEQLQRSPRPCPPPSPPIAVMWGGYWLTKTCTNRATSLMIGDCFSDCWTRSLRQHVIKTVFHTRGFIFWGHILQMTVIIDVFSALMCFWFPSSFLRVPRCHMNGCLLDNFQCSPHVLSKQRCYEWNKSWFWASKIKANALIYCHGYCNSVIHTYCTSADSQPFKQCIVAYGRFWSASPAAKENKFIFRTVFLCLAKSIMNMPFIFIRSIKKNRLSPRIEKHGEDRSAAYISIYEVVRLRVFNHPSSDPVSLSFYRCQNELSAFVLRNKIDVWYTVTIAAYFLHYY